MRACESPVIKRSSATRGSLRGSPDAAPALLYDARRTPDRARLATRAATRGGSFSSTKMQCVVGRRRCCGHCGSERRSHRAGGRRHRRHRPCGRPRRAGDRTLTGDHHAVGMVVRHRLLAQVDRGTRARVRARSRRSRSTARGCSPQDRSSGDDGTREVGCAAATHGQSTACGGRRGGRSMLRDLRGNVAAAPFATQPAEAAAADARRRDVGPRAQSSATRAARGTWPAPPAARR